MELRLRGCHRITVDVAPEPSDIIWENLGTTRRHRLMRRLLASSVSLVSKILGNFCSL